MGNLRHVTILPRVDPSETNRVEYICGVEAGKVKNKTNISRSNSAEVEWGLAQLDAVFDHN